jgi:hypothetical protein
MLTLVNVARAQDGGTGDAPAPDSAFETPEPEQAPVVEVFSGPDTSQHAGPRTWHGDARGQLHLVGDGEAYTSSGVRFAMQTTSRSVKSGKKTITYFTFQYVGPRGASTIGQWNSEEAYPTTWAAHGARFGTDGHFYALVCREVHSDSNFRRDLLLFRDGAPVQTLYGSLGLPISKAHLLLDSANRPIVFYKASMRYQIEQITAPSRARVVFADADYDWSVARDARGWVYVVAYDYTRRSLVVHASLEGRGPWMRMDVDGRESGWQHSVAAHRDRLYVLSYFMRNTFNRGLNVFEFADGRLLSNRTHFRRRDRNGGWSPSLGIARDGRVDVTYTEDEQGGAETHRRYPDVASFLAVSVPEADGWEAEARSWSVSAEVMPRYRSWRIVAHQPSKTDAPVQAETDYDYDPALEIGASLEGQVGGVNLGLLYMRSVASDAIESAAGSVAGRSFQFFAGFIGFDELLFGHDLKLSSSFGRATGRFTAGSGPPVARETDVTEFELRLLNQWRVGYGLAYRGYDLPLPFYTYRAYEGERAYTQLGAGIVDAEIHRFEFFLGYSRLDYMTKYENAFNGIDVDFRFGLGLSVMSWPMVEVADEEVDGVVALSMSTALRLGWAYYKRFYDLQGAGFFVRAGYEAAWLGAGFGNGAPSKRDEDDVDDEATSSYAAHHQILHGPYLGLGLVY